MKLWCYLNTWLGLCWCAGAVDPPMRPRRPAIFGLDSLSDVVLPVIHPIISAGSNRCEFVKSLFGLTYEQMQQKNLSRVQEELHIDVINKNGSVQYNITAAKKLSRLTSNLTKIIILIHGFMESSDGLMVQNLAPELLKKPGLSKLMALDGRNLITLEYIRSSTYARFMGEKLGTLLADIVQMGTDANRLLLVGHSLGAHIAGFAGRRVAGLTRQRVGRIVALDPAGPCFTGARGAPADRLATTDALRVDVVHTNGGILGLKEPVGHYDFFPNGGLTQPGCALALCDHSRAWQLYAEAVGNPKRFPARKCENWTSFRQGRCSKEAVAYLGLDAPALAARPGSYFLVTGSSPPFGLGSKSIHF